MTPSSIFLLQALFIVAAPVALLRLSGLKGLVPLVVVQILVGIALGPTVFGRLAPDYFEMFANLAVLSPLSGLASVAVLIFGLMTGLHLDPSVFRSNGRVFWGVAVANMVVPFILGVGAAYWVLDRHPGELLPGVTRFEFMAALGLCVSMKALPVLGGILGEMGLLGRRIGSLALGVAGVNDIVLWAILGVLLTATADPGKGGHSLVSPAYLLVLLPTYLAAMVLVVRPLLFRLLTARMRDSSVGRRPMVIVCAITIASALCTEMMGLHYIVGAFLIGVVTPMSLRKPILDQLQVLTVALLMPFFFTLTGARTLIDLNSATFTDIMLSTLFASSIGIIAGTVGAARSLGETWSTSFGLGSLLQAKGLTELIVLTVLLDEKIISVHVFSAMIVMAVVTTSIAMPLARYALSSSPADPAAEQPSAAFIR